MERYIKSQDSVPVNVMLVLCVNLDGPCYALIIGSAWFLGAFSTILAFEYGGWPSSMWVALIINVGRLPLSI